MLTARALRCDVLRHIPQYAVKYTIIFYNLILTVETSRFGPKVCLVFCFDNYFFLPFRVQTRSGENICLQNVSPWKARYPRRFGGE